MTRTTLRSFSSRVFLPLSALLLNSMLIACASEDDGSANSAGNSESGSNQSNETGSEEETSEKSASNETTGPEDSGGDDNSPDSDNDSESGPSENSEESDTGSEEPQDQGEAITDGIIYVDANASGDDNGGDWPNAYTDLAHALGVARYLSEQNTSDSFELWVAAGTYRAGDDPEDHFELSSRVKLYGGFAGNEEQKGTRDPETNLTVLSGQLSDEIQSNTLLHLEGLEDTLIDGFTLQDTHSDHQTAPWESPGRSGGGIWCDGSQVELGNIQIQNTSAEKLGGAIYANDCDVTVSGKLSIVDAYSKNKGGGIYANAGTWIIQNNAALYLRNNRTLDEGGAFWMKASELTVEPDATLIGDNNTGGNTGGTIYGLESQLNIKGAMKLLGNHTTGAVSDGGAIWWSDGDINVDGQLELEQSEVTSRGAGVFLSNGALLVSEQSSLSISKGEAYNGAGVFLASGSTLEATGQLYFGENESANFAGGIIVLSSTHLKMNGPAIFEKNHAGDGGGAIMVGLGGQLTVQPNAQIEMNQNTAQIRGGAMMHWGVAGIEFEENSQTKMDGNRSIEGDGGAIWHGGNSPMNVAGSIELNHNQALAGRGGGLFVEGVSGNSDHIPAAQLHVEDTGSISGSGNQAQEGGGFYSAGVLSGAEGITVEGSPENVLVEPAKDE